MTDQPGQPNAVPKHGWDLKTFLGGCLAPVVVIGGGVAFYLLAPTRVFWLVAVAIAAVAIASGIAVGTKGPTRYLVPAGLLAIVLGLEAFAVRDSWHLEATIAMIAGLGLFVGGCCAAVPRWRDTRLVASVVGGVAAASFALGAAAFVVHSSAGYIRQYGVPVRVTLPHTCVLTIELKKDGNSWVTCDDATWVEGGQRVTGRLTGSPAALGGILHVAGADAYAYEGRAVAAADVGEVGENVVLGNLPAWLMLPLPMLFGWLAIRAWLRGRRFRASQPS